TPARAIFMQDRSRSLYRVLVVLVVAGIVASACGSSSKSSSSKPGSATTSGSSSAALGSEKKATGTPIKVGLISDGKSEAIDNTAEITAAKASAEYLNNYGGGVNGHPIDLVTCETHQTPSGATDCSTKMVDAKVVAVLYGVSGQGGSIFKGLEGSNIPLIAWASIDQDTLLKPGAFALTNGLG